MTREELPRGTFRGSLAGVFAAGAFWFGGWPSGVVALSAIALLALMTREVRPEKSYARSWLPDVLMGVVVAGLLWSSGWRWGAVAFLAFALLAKVVRARARRRIGSFSWRSTWTRSAGP